MRFLNVKTNALRRNANKEFTLHSSTNRDALCEACASFNACSKKLSQTQCRDFIPVLRFSVNAVLYDTGRRNTVRTGQAWLKRLDVGSKIALWDGIENKLSMAVVTEIYWGENKDEFIEKHGDFNHMVLSKEINKARFKDLLETCIGRGFYRRANGLTAIYYTLI